MRNDVRGLFPLEPPPGGLARLRRDMQRAGSEPGWLPLLPWATAASLLVAVLVAMHRGQAGLTHRIEAQVRSQEPASWTPLPPGQNGVRVYLARPTD